MLSTDWGTKRWSTDDEYVEISIIAMQINEKVVSVFKMIHLLFPIWLESSLHEGISIDHKTQFQMFVVERE